MAEHYRSNASLAKRVRDHHDHAAFALLVDRHRPMLKTFRRDFQWALQELAEWDDLLQEALLGLWAACETYDPRWGTLFGTYAEPFARRRLGHAIRAARTHKARMLREAEDLDAAVDTDTGPSTLGETVAAPDYWQPEVMSEIRHELRVLSAELTQALSSVEREALASIMLEEQRPPARLRRASGRVREKAARALGREHRDLPTRGGRRTQGMELLKAGHSQREVAERIGVAQTTVSNWARAAA